MGGALDRRTFLKASLAAGGGLLLGFRLWEAADAAEAWVPNAYLEIAPDGKVVVLVPKSEMGQGVLTALPALVAEELDVDLAQVTAVHAPAAGPYRWSFGQQLTGGSDAVRRAWTIMREAGAAARALLVEAAARTWDVPVAQCSTENGRVVHATSGRKLAYADLIGVAATLRPPGRVTLKDPKAFRLVGTRFARLDSRPKTDGSAKFGLDAALPGLLVACVARAPFGARLRSFEDKAARAVPGVRHVTKIAAGVAVVADSYWQARKGVEALEIDWEPGPHATLSSEQLEKRFATLALRPSKTLKSVGDATAVIAGSQRRLGAEYWTPFLAHAAMEPLNCTADVGADRCDIWVGTQAQTLAQRAAVAITGFPEEKVHVHTLMLGGGFGRRAEADFVADAVELSRLLGKPIKVVWSRQDDLSSDYYRPCTYHRMEGAVSEDGWPAAWVHHLVSTSVIERFMAIAPETFLRDPLAFMRAHEAEDRKNLTKTFMGSDPVVTDGLDDQPYAFPAQRMAVRFERTGVPVGFWRSVGFSHNTFAVESFLDELAAMGGKDPLEVRLRLLEGHPRLKAVLALAAAKAGWDKPLPAGRFRGLAAAEPFGSFVAQVAEISIEDGEIKVHRVVCAIDCGFVVNPAIVENQMESGIAYGLSAALGGEITLQGGKVVQSNFHDYPVVRMSGMPRVDVHIVPSVESPGGVGEVGVPCVAPAVANAVRAATGKPVRRLPIKIQA